MFGQQQQPGDKDLEIPLPANSDSISALQWSPVGSFLSASSWDNKLRVWEIGRNQVNGQPMAAAPKLEQDMGAPILDHYWRDDGQSLFAVGCNKTVKLWSLATNSVTDIGSHDAPIKTVFWAKERQFLVTGGWDKTIRFWDTRTPTPQLSVSMPERVYAMDVKHPLMVVCTADAKIYIFNLDQPQRPFREMASPLKMIPRCVRAFHNKQLFAVGSIEGRCAIRCVDEKLDNSTEVDTRPSFAFKCHREGALIYSINSIDVHPHPELQSIFSTAGADGSFTYWDKDKRTRLKEYKVSKQPVSAGLWNPTGDLFGYAVSYDWLKGQEGYNLQTDPTRLFVHWSTVEKDFRPAPLAQQGRR